MASGAGGAVKKIPTLFVRDPENRARVLPEFAVDLPVDAVATGKFDGTCVMLDADGRWWARREVKPGKTPPEGFVPISTDEVTGKIMGWEPAEQSGFWKFLEEALVEQTEFDATRVPNTYELIGPRVNGNPHGLDEHVLVQHGMVDDYMDGPVTFESVQERLVTATLEGIVWWSGGKPVAKIKRRDFGLPWPIQ